MPITNKVYDRVRIIGRSHSDPKLEDEVLGRQLSTPTRVLRELTVVALEDCDFFVERHLAPIVVDGETRYIENVGKRIPLGLVAGGPFFKISPKLFGFLGVKVAGVNYVPSDLSIPRVYKILSKYDNQTT